MEEWKKVPGFDYEISIATKEGKCRNINWRKGHTRTLKNYHSPKDNRVYWTLSKDGHPTSQQAARWIALTYPELVQNEYFEGAEIDHIDTDPLNNHPSNLRWVDSYGQMNNPLTKKHLSESRKGHIHSAETKEKMSLSMTGIHLNRKDLSKHVEQLSLSGNHIEYFPSISEAARQTSTAYQNISACCHGRQKTAKGFKWRLV